MTNPADLVGVSEIAELFDVRPSAVSNWQARAVDFPQPWGTWRFGALWIREDIEAWWANRQARNTARRDAEIARLENRIARLKEGGTT